MVTRRTWLVIAAVLTCLIASVKARPAAAACTNPTEPAGAIIFNSAYRTLQYCGGNNWIAFPNSAASSTVLPTAGLVSRFLLDETGGTGIVDVQGNMTGTWQGTPSTAQSVEGVNGTALQFNGTSTRVEAPKNTANTLTQFTIAGWVKGNAAPSGTEVGLFGRGSNFMIEYDHQYLPPHCEYEDVNGGYEFTNVSTTLGAGVWYHLACTFDGTTMKFFVNGVLQQAVTVAVQPKTTKPDLFTIGAYSFNGTSDSYFNGAIDDVVLYNRALSDAEVTALAGNPPSPYVISAAGSITMPAKPRAIAVQGNYAYVGIDSASRFSVIDISNPDSLTQVGTVQNTALLSGIRSIKVAGNYAYAAGASVDSFVVLNISNPASPTIVGSITDGTNLDLPFDIAINGAYAYVSSNLKNRLTVINISNPAAPVVVGSVADALLGSPHGISYQNALVYVTGYGNDRLTVVDVANPSAPTVLGSLQNSTAMDGAFDVDVKGKYAYVVGETSDSFAVLDVSNSASPTLVGYITDPRLDVVRAVSVRGNYAFATATDGDRVVLIDVSNPASPSIVYALGGTNFDGANDLAMGGGHAYVASVNSNDVTAVKIGCTGPSAPMGSLIFNAAYKVLQWCDGNGWRAAGPVSPTGATGGCSSPSGGAGDIVYNTAYSALQYCDGGHWQGIGD